MLDFEVQTCTRRCAKSGDELKPGEVFYSMLVPSGGDVVRQDFNEQSWEGPTDESLGWWKSQMPSPASNKMNWAPNDVMLHYFQELENQPEKTDIRFVLALLMIRRRIVRLEESETDDQDREVMVLFCPKNEHEYKVVVEHPEGERVAAIQDELGKLLFGDES